MTSDIVEAIQLYQPASLNSTWLMMSLCLESPPLGKEYLGSWMGSSSESFLCHVMEGTCGLIRDGIVRFAYNLNRSLFFDGKIIGWASSHLRAGRDHCVVFLVKMVYS